MGEMIAGRELDARVAEKVMGIPAAWIHDEPNGKMVDVDGHMSHIAANAHYSTDIPAAWQVVDAMQEKGWSFRYGNNGYCSKQKVAAFARGYRGLGRNILTGDYIEADDAVSGADTAPLAICRAALKAMEQA